VEKQLAQSIHHQIEQWDQTGNSTSYELESLEIVQDSLPGFHQWTNGKKVIAGYSVTKIGFDSYYILLIDWHRNENYYLVIYSADKSTTLAELQTVVEKDEQHSIQWKYMPLKRDGKNEKRKAYFTKAFGSTNVEIPLPMAEKNVETFFDQLFTLCQNRKKADRSVTSFGSEL
jgi:hypothetical protein